MRDDDWIAHFGRYAPDRTAVVDFADGSVSPVDPTSAGGRPIRLVRAGQ